MTNDERVKGRVQSPKERINNFLIIVMKLKKKQVDVFIVKIQDV